MRDIINKFYKDNKSNKCNDLKINSVIQLYDEAQNDYYDYQ